jgi:hypothetical protein
MKKFMLPIILGAVIIVAALVILVSKKPKESGLTPVAIASSSPTSALLATIEAQYTDENAVKSYAATTGFPVYYFTSSSCTTCKTTEADLRANAAYIPAGVKIFVVDYDKETALVRKYAVSGPSTWVQVNANGEQVRTWLGQGVASISANLMTSDSDN